jgi:hypothetical protein
LLRKYPRLFGSHVEFFEEAASMDARSSLTQAEGVVAEQRRLLAEEGDRHRPELAKALLELSRAYERDDRTEDALATAHEGVATLAPNFLAKPRWLAGSIRALVAQYVALAQRSRAEPDEALLTPIAQALGDLNRAEDEADD